MSVRRMDAPVCLLLVKPGSATVDSVKHELIHCSSHSSMISGVAVRQHIEEKKKKKVQ